MSLAFLATLLLIIVTRGTGALLTISAGLTLGRRQAVTAAGCTLGIVPHLAAALLGASSTTSGCCGPTFTVTSLTVGYALRIAPACLKDLFGGALHHLRVRPGRPEFAHRPPARLHRRGFSV